MKSPILADIENLESTVAQATASAVEAVEQLRAAISERRQERARLSTAPVPHAEASERFCAWVDETAARYAAAESHGPYDQTIFARDDLRPLILWEKVEPPFPGGGLGLGAICFWLGDILKARARTGIPTIGGYGIPGSRSTERQAQLEALDREVTDFEAGEERIIRAARKAGLRVPRRPEVQRAIDDEVQRLERRHDDLTQAIEYHSANARSPHEAARLERVIELRKELAEIAPRLAELREIR